MEIYIENLSSELEIEESAIEDIENAIFTTLKHLGCDENFEISISIVNEEEIKDLNRDYRGVDSVTDVLSFPLFERDQIPNEGMLGDIVICDKKVMEQAEEFGHSFQRELVYLTVHSMLHLLGFDHIDANDKIEMRTKEKEIMQILGIFK